MKVVYSAIVALALTGCGSSSGDSDDGSQGMKVERNVAAEANGASITASYDQQGAGYVIDGDNATNTYWTAQVTDDVFTIDFGSVASVSEITIYTNDLSFSTSNPNKIVEVSSNGNEWLRTSEIIGGDIACASSFTGSGRMTCEFAQSEDIRYLRLTVTKDIDPQLVEIYEVEVTGI